MKNAERRIWDLSDEERQRWRWIARAFVVLAVAMFLWQVLVLNIEWHHVAGCMMIGLTVGKWAVPHVRRLDTDRYPSGRDFEMASASLSDRHALSSVGQWDIPFDRKRYQ